MHGITPRTRALFLRCCAVVVAGAVIACGKPTPGAGDSAAVGADPGDTRKHQPGVVMLDTTALRLGGITVGRAGSRTNSEIPLTGTITYDANRVSHIGARMQGRVTALRADLGVRVRRGVVLAMLESPEVGQIRASEREAEALVRIAAENHAREQRLAQQGISSRKELLAAEADLRRAEASLRAAEEKLRVLGAGHGVGSQFAVVSPFDGVVVARDASLGEMASPETTLFTVADLSRVWIELDVFERDLARVRVGQPVSVSVTAYPERTFPGRIVYVGAVLDPAKRTARARVEIPNPDGALKPGMFARATVQAGAGGPPVAVVPDDAVQEVGGKRVVFVPGTARGEFRAVTVETGEPADSGRIVIRSGLAPGSPVVLTGAFALRSELQKDELKEGGE